MILKLLTVGAITTVLSLGVGFAAAEGASTAAGTTTKQADGAKKHHRGFKKRGFRHGGCRGKCNKANKAQKPAEAPKERDKGGNE